MRRNRNLAAVVAVVACGLVRSSPSEAAPAATPRHRALAAVAEAAGWTLVDCPAPVGDHGLPLPRASLNDISDPGRLAFATREPAGALPISRGDWRAQADPANVPRTMLRWTTDASGATTCLEVPVEQHEIAIRVVDPSGSPVEGASGFVDVPHASCTVAGPDGAIRCPVPSADAFDVTVATTESAWGSAHVSATDGVVTVAVGPASTEEAFRVARNAANQADVRDQLAAVEAVQANGALDPAATSALADIHTELVEQLRTLQ